MPATVDHGWSTGYAPSQVTNLKLELLLHSSQANTPYVSGEVYKADGSLESGSISSSIPGTSDVWISWQTTNVSNYLKSDGTFGCRLCMCGNVPNPVAYQISIDTARLTLTLNSPVPVANFTGTPTSGTAPLAVTFTDSSTNGPTAWSWTFGDGGTSTAQNPSHTYTSTGSYTVSLTATNRAATIPTPRATTSPCPWRPR